MKSKPKFTNKQRKAMGIKTHDNGQKSHYAEKANTSRQNDNVRAD